MVIYITHHKLETELIADEVVYLSSRKVAPAKIYRDGLLNFIKQPPLLEALEVFTYPKPNIIKAKMSNNVIVPVNGKDDNSIFYFGAKDENIVFSDSGLEYNVVVSNPINTTVVLGTSEQQLTVNTELIKNNQNKHITFGGVINTYNESGEFIKMISI